MTRKKSDEQTEASQLGVEVGMLMAGAMVHLDLLSHVGPVLNSLQDSPTFDAFSKAFVSTLVRASKGGVEGVRNRSDMAHHLRVGHAELSKRAADLAIQSRGQGGEKMWAKLQHIVESSRCLGRAAEALFAPIDRNLTNLVESGRQILAIQAAKQERDAVEAAIQVAQHDCGDVRCPVHTKN